MGLGTSSAVLETLGRNNPSFALEVDFGPSGTDHLARPEPRQQRDFKRPGGNALSLVQGSEELRRLLVIKGSLPTTS